MIRVFYHSADLDGHCSGAIVKSKYPDAIMYPINYGDKFPWDDVPSFVSDDTVFVVDFCLQPFSDMARLCNRAKVIWIDHHKSAIESYLDFTSRFNSYLPITRRTDMSKAACELTWEHIYPEEPIPLTVKLLSLYDSWTYQGHELESKVLPFQMRLRMMNLDPKFGKDAWKWRDLLQMEECGVLTQYLSEGELLLQYDDEQKKKYCRTFAFETELVPFCDICNRKTAGNYDPNVCEHQPHYKAIAVNLGHTSSKVFDSVWKKKCPDCFDGKRQVIDELSVVERVHCLTCDGKSYIEPYDVMLTFCRGKRKEWNVGLYSTKPDIDCGAICKTFGGGGHKGAAGFQVEELPFEY